ncbi:hypothetical protein EYF80_035757 [Liparis tanakae]|uniref:Uncharacterized protein n=1 Tax=Liparis tanakae TaxID=230148 RepID=A0A4Z2GMK8_9TELE|nr:hypothetical protein EYF80_035757 [Liparis tanakae]
MKQKNTEDWDWNRNTGDWDWTRNWNNRDWNRNTRNWTQNTRNWTRNTGNWNNRLGGACHLQRLQQEFILRLLGCYCCLQTKQPLHRTVERLVGGLQRLGLEDRRRAGMTDRQVERPQ